MTALTSDVNRTEKQGKLIAYPVKGATKVFKNALVKINAAGYLEGCATEAGAVYAGMAYESKDNLLGADGEEVCRVERLNAIYCNGAGFVAADLGKKAYALDDNTVQIAAGTNLQIVGEIIEVVSATEVVVSQTAASQSK